MKKLCALLSVLALFGAAEASWYWPFGSDDDDVKEPRLSDLMEPASDHIDAASDLADEGKLDKAVEEYKAALQELDRIVAENPERVERPEFATLRTKRAYVNAAIDSLLMRQAKENAKAVAVSDTTELEARLAAEKAEKAGLPAKTDENSENQPVAAEEPEVKPVEPEVRPAAPEVKPEVRQEVKNSPVSPRERAMQALDAGEYAAAEAAIGEMLKANPKSAAALNLKAACATAQGKYKEAERALDLAIESNRNSYYAYYNMADLILRANPDNKAGARRYYETGRAMGGPEDQDLEAMLK